MRREITYTHVTMTCDRCLEARETRKVWGHDYCRACYPVILGLSKVAIDDRWLPIERFPHLIAATRWAEPTLWGPVRRAFSMRVAVVALE